MATQTHTIKQGDTGPAIRATLAGVGNVVQALSGAQVKFNMRNATGTVVINRGDCDIIDPTLGKVSYSWQPSDTVSAGSFQGEFEVTFSDDTVVTFPNTGNFAIKITPQIR
jgi:hypothetical protein